MGDVVDVVDAAFVVLDVSRGEQVVEWAVVIGRAPSPPLWL